MAIRRYRPINYPTSASSVAWGSITGTLSNQTDLQSALDAKGTLSNVVEDTTPQLGGALDAQGNNITSVGDLELDQSTDTWQIRVNPDSDPFYAGTLQFNSPDNLKFWMYSDASPASTMGMTTGGTYSAPPARSDTVDYATFAIYGDTEYLLAEMGFNAGNGDFYLGNEMYQGRLYLYGTDSAANYRTGLMWDPQARLLDAVDATQVNLGTMSFDADQTIGAGQDNYVLTYDNSTGLISLEAAAGGGGGDVTKVGTPANNQVGVWTGDGTIEGDSNFTWDGTGITLQGTADVSISLIADTNNGVGEDENPYIYMSQDGGVVYSSIGMSSTGLDGRGLTFTGMNQNGIAIHCDYSSGAIGMGVGGSVALQIDSTNDVNIKGGNNFIIYNFGETDSATFSHDGVDFNTAFVGTLDWNITGLNNFKVGNFHFDVDQTVGAGQDNYVLTYDHASAKILLEAASGGGGGGGTIGGSIADNQIAVGATTADEIEGDSGFTYANDVLTLDAGSTAVTPKVILTGNYDVGIHLVADNDNITESHNPYIFFSQDGGAVLGTIGMTQTGTDSMGNAFTNMPENSIAIHAQYAGTSVALGVNGSVGLKVDDSNNITGYGNIVLGSESITETKIGQWDTAYGWGNHASAGYLTSVAVSDLDNGTDGQIITWDASGVATTVGPGTSGQVLTSNGAGAAPSFQAAPGGSSGETKYPTSDVERTSTTMTADGTMTGYALSSDTWYKVEGYILTMHDDTTVDFKCDFNFTNTPQDAWFTIEGQNSNGSASDGDHAQYTADMVLNVTVAGEWGWHLKGYIRSNATTGGTASYRWAANSLSPGNGVTVRAGSWITITPL